MLQRLARAVLTGALVTGLSLAPAGPVLAVSGADLAITFQGPMRVKSQSLVTYTITVTNLGPDVARNILVSGGGGDQFDPVSVHCQDNGSYGQSACHPGDLEAGASVTATYQVYVCCLFRGENRHAFVAVSVGQDPTPDPDPNLDNNWAQQDVFVIGRRVK
jgi:hypothetical protein